MNNEALVQKIVRDVAELPDRTSPEDWPEAMLVTSKELAGIIRKALSATQPTEKAANHIASCAQSASDLDQKLAFGKQRFLDGLRAAIIICDELRYAIDNGGNIYHRPADADQCVDMLREAFRVATGNDSVSTAHSADEVRS